MSIDNIIGLVLIPILLAVLGIIWKQLDGLKNMVSTETGKLWIDFGSFKEAYSKNRLEDDRRYANKDDLGEFKEEIRNSLDKVTQSIEKLSDRLPPRQKGVG